MIYLFDRAKKLQKIIPRKHIINANPTVVRNGIYQLAVEVPLFYEDKKGTQYNYQKSVEKATFAGHYDDKNRFQLYKIYSRNINANDQGEILLFDGVHIFFDEAKAMGNIHDRRFRDSEAKAPADVAFNSIGWTVIDYDVTDRHDINFYRASVTDAWNDLISTYGVEFDYELQFDGRKIISKNIIMKKQIGRWTGQRFAYGTNVLTLTQEQDESEVYTAAVGRGRGEEAGDGFGPRLEFGDIAWSKDGITKPVGRNYIELPSATAEYGFIENGVVKPRIAPEIIFEDIEDKKELADSTYYWLLENCVPKATWKTDVARIGNLSLGDTVGVLYKAAGIIKRARVEKIEYNLLDPELSKLTLGDFHHFEDRQMKRINAQIKRLGRDSNDRITRIKNEWNAWIDNQFTAAKNEYEQALIDVHAEIEADRENMTNLINTTRNDWTDTFEAEVAEIYRKAGEDYNRIETEITETIDSTRAEIETEFNESVQNTREYADNQIADKEAQYEDNWNQRDADIQQTIEMVVGGSIESLDTNLLDVNSRLLSKLDESDLHPLYGRIDDAFIDISDVSGELSSAREGLQAQLDAARAELEGLEVGGRNLLIMKDLNLSRHSNTAVDVENGLISGFGSYYFIFENVNMKADTFYTFSYVSSISIRLSFLIRNKETGDIQYIWNAEILPPNEKVTFKVPENILSETENYHMWVYISNSETIEWQVEKIQLEKGTVATDWSMAPEDAEQKITNINQTITNIEGELSSKVEQTEVDALKGTVTAQGTLLTQTADEVSSKAEKSVVDTLTGRVANAESSVTQNAEEIAKKLTKSVYDSDKKATDAKLTQWSNTATETAEGLERVIGRVSETETGVETAQTRIEAEAGRITGLLSRTSEVEGQVQDARLAIEANADGLALRATKTEVENAIDNIEVGGRNLLPAFTSNRWTHTNLTEVEDYSLYFPSGHGGNSIIFIDVEKQTNYTMTFNSDYARYYIYEVLEDDSLGSIIRTRTGSETYTFNTEDISKIRVSLNTFSGNLQEEKNIWNLKLERGNKVTDWTPAPEDIRADITQLNTDINIEAGRINALLTRTSEAEDAIADIHLGVDGITADFANYKQDIDSDVGALTSQVASYEAGVDGFRAEVGTLQGNMDDLESWRNDKGSLFEQTAEGFRQRVWTRDIDPLTQRLDGHEAYISDLQLTADSFGVTIGEVESGLIDRINGIQTWHYNLLRGTRFDETEFVTPSGGSILTDEEIPYFYYDSGWSSTYVEIGQEMNFQEGIEYTLSFDVQAYRLAEMDYIRIQASPDDEVGANYNIAANGIGTHDKIKWGSEYQRFYVRFTPPRNVLGKIRIGAFLTNQPLGSFPFKLRLPYLTESDNTTWLYHQLDTVQNTEELSRRISSFEQTIDQISATVQDIDQDVVKQSQVYVGASGVQIGSTYIGDSEFSSIFRVSPRTIDAVAEQMRVSGDLYVKGEIQSFAMEAVEGEFGRLWADEFEAITIDAEMITSGTMSAERIRVGHAFVNRIMGQSVFADEVTAITGNFIDLNAGNIVTAGLSANVITSDHIEVSTALIDKFFATSARIDELITKTHFVTEMHGLTLNVVELNASEIRARLLTANTIEASWIKSGTALLDRVFSSTAMFERMMAKSGFVTTLNTVTIDTDQITIRRPDGGMLINNGVANWDFDVQMEEFMETTGVEWNGQWYETKRDTPTRVKIGSFKHSGTQLKLNIMVRLSGSSPAASELMFVTVRSFGGSLDYNVRRQYQVYRSSSQSKEFKVNLGVPEYGASMFYLEFQRDPLGTNSENIVQVRCNRAWQDG